MSARSFYEPKFVTEFIGKYLNIRDFNRPLTDSDRVKVFYLMFIQQVNSNIIEKDALVLYKLYVCTR